MLFSGQSLQDNINVDLDSGNQGRHFMLMDCSIDNSLVQQYFDLDNDPEYFPLFLGHDELIPISPYLIEIKNSTSSFLNWFSHNSKQWGFIYYSSYSLDDQSLYWQSLLEVILVNGKTNMLRFSDCRITIALWEQFTEQEKALFFQPCQYLHFQTERNQWHRHKSQEAESLIYKTDRPWFHLSEITQTHLDNLSNSVLEENLLDTLWLHYPSILGKLPENTVSFLIRSGIKTAKSLQIQSEKHLALFVSLMFEYAPNFFNDPKAIQHFENERLAGQNNFGQIALDRILETFTNNDWSRVAANTNLTV